MPTLSDYGMQPLSGTEYGGMLSDLIRVPFADAMLRADRVAPRVRRARERVRTTPDGYRAVAPHLAARPGSEVLIVNHGLRVSILLYALQAALALGSDRRGLRERRRRVAPIAERLGARPVETDFAGRPPRTYGIVVDAGVTPTASRTRSAQRSPRDLPERQLPPR